MQLRPIDAVRKYLVFAFQPISAVAHVAQQPVRHSLWEQDSLEALNEVLAGCLEGEVRALKQRRADYDEERRQSEGSDSCWSGADSDPDSAAELEVVDEPSALEGAAAEQGEVHTCFRKKKEFRNHCYGLGMGLARFWHCARD